MDKNFVCDEYERDEVVLKDEGEDREPLEVEELDNRDEVEVDLEEEDGKDFYKKDGFIVDDEEEKDQDEEEERARSDEERQKKMKKRVKKEWEDILDEDDYELLLVNDAFYPLTKERKKYKRLKKAKRDSDEEHSGFSDEEFDGGGKGGRTTEPIWAIDVPERMQTFEEGTSPPLMDETSLLEESSWMESQLKQLPSNVVSLLIDDEKPAVNRDDIIRFLKLVQMQKLDIPFIAKYRKEDCLSLLRDYRQHEDDGENQNKHDNDDDENLDKSWWTDTLKWHKLLWAVRDLDRKWLLLQKRKNALHLYYNKCFEEESHRIYNETRLNLNQQLFESILKSLKAAESEREVDDVDVKFNLHFPLGEVGADEGQYKRLKRTSQYSICSKAGLWEVASKFGHSAEQFGQELCKGELNDELEDAKETPEEMASNFTCAMFETPQAVLKGARQMAAVEISCEPSVRKWFRGFFLERAILSTSPTPDGNFAIDSFHQFAGIKWLREKPLGTFKDAQWLLIQKAEEEKLLQVTFKLSDEALSLLKEEFDGHYLSRGVSKSPQVWNEQRRMILHDAIYNSLIPSMEKEVRSLLTSRAKSWLSLEYGNALWNRVSVGSYQRKENDLSHDDAAPRVMACTWGPGKPATTFVMLDSSGEVLDVLHAGSLSLRPQNVNDQQRKKQDQQRVLKFMTDHRPHVVVLGAANLSCTRLKEDIYEIIHKMVEENSRNVGHEMKELSIVYGDESLPRLYENSRVSSDQFPGQPGIVKRAVALGRYLQNPLAMAATLCGPWREILSWKLNPLENFLPSDEKYGMVEQVMVDAINQIGLDVNLAISHEWLFAPLQFVSGLGPRKAASLQRSLVRAGAIFTRKDFVTTHGLGKKVFVNAVGFLRVRRSGLAASSSQFINLLDDTRIHPESYGVAQDLAKYIYDEDVNGDTNDDEDALEMAIEHVRDRPNLLKSLDIDAYLKSKNLENKRETFDDIRRELMQGFRDFRKPYEEPSQDEEFYMISGETEDTLAEGMIVQGTVRKVLGEKVICVLEKGLTGMLMRESVADDWGDDVELSDRLHEGDILTCRISSVLKDRYQVFLSCKKSDMRNNRDQLLQNFDPYYHEDQSSVRSEQEKARKEELAKKNFKPRTIVHPRFQNMTADEAVELLSDKDPGESIIRPSSRGPSYLTLTFKVYDGVHAHKDIVEGGKELKDITSLLRIGKTLKIGEDTFENLDEVIDRYVDPLVGNLKAILSHHKFRRGTKAEVDELLRVEKSEYPMRIVYAFGISHEHPGTFILTYIRSTNPRHEYVGLHPKGFKFRKRMFEDIGRLVAYFQKHIDDPLHESAPSVKGQGWGGSTIEDGGRGQSFDRHRAFTPASRTGRKDYRNGEGQDGHPSGLRRPYGERGHDRSSTNERQDTGYDASLKWDSDSKDENDGWTKFPGAKVQNSPGSGWGTIGGGSGGGINSGWGKDGGSGSGSAGGDGDAGWEQGSGGGGRSGSGIGGGSSWGASGGGRNNAGWGRGSGGDEKGSDDVSSWGLACGGEKQSGGGNSWVATGRGENKAGWGQGSGGHEKGSGVSSWEVARGSEKQSGGGSSWGATAAGGGGGDKAGWGQGSGGDEKGSGVSSWGVAGGGEKQSGGGSSCVADRGGNKAGWGQGSGGSGWGVGRGGEKGSGGGGNNAGCGQGSGGDEKGWGVAGGSEKESDGGSSWGGTGEKGSGGGSSWGAASEKGSGGCNNTGWGRGNSGGGSDDGDSGWGTSSKKSSMPAKPDNVWSRGGSGW